MTLQERYRKIISYFQESKPVAETELRYSDPYQLIVAVILSAQCTDKRVNMITPVLFEKFPSFEALAGADPGEVLSLIRSCSYPNSKTKYLTGMAKTVTMKYDGLLPEAPEELMKLPGVGRKTANVISVIIHGKAAMPVDTHVFRVAARIGLTREAKTPYASEIQLVKNFPPEVLADAHHWLLLHGRYVCTARNPKCDICGLKGICIYYNKVIKKKRPVAEVT
jgi:endonuclease III